MQGVTEGGSYLGPYIIAKLPKYPFDIANRSINTTGKTSWLKKTGTVLGCALQNINNGMNAMRATEIIGNIHLGHLFLG